MSEADLDDGLAPQQVRRLMGGGALLAVGVDELDAGRAEALARNLAVEWGPSNIRSNCIAPGLVKTDFARALWEDPEQTKRALAAYPIGRLGEPEDIAGAALFLASKAGSFVNGHTLVVDGGSTIGSSRYS